MMKMMMAGMDPEMKKKCSEMMAAFMKEDK
jgi:hypothetical protein